MLKVSKAKEILTNLFILLCTILCILTASEIACRIIFSKYKNFDIEMWRYTKLLKKKSNDALISHEHIQNKKANLMEIEIKINSKGLRDYEYPYNKPPNTFRILALGDSITLGWGVEFKKIFPKALEKLLNKDSKITLPPLAMTQKAVVDKLSMQYKKYEVINTGVGNYNTEQEAAYFTKEGIRYAPNLVILNFFVNDAEETSPISKYYRWDIPYFYIFLWTEFDLIFRKFGSRKDYHNYYLSLYNEHNIGWQKCKKAISNLAKLCEKNEINLFIVIIPELHKLPIKNPFQGIVDKVKKEGDEHNISVFDLYENFAGKRPELLWVAKDDAHPNAQGHEIIGEAIYKYLSRINRKRIKHELHQ